MATRTLGYGSASTPTITLDGLASHDTAGRASTAVTCSGEPYGVLECTFVTENSGAVANDKGVHVWLAQSVDAGTSYEDGVSAGDAAYTPISTRNMRYLGMVECLAINATYRKTFMVYEPPEQFVVVVRNYCGTNLESGSAIKYYPVTETFA
jgi:hypothetical protein